MDVRLSPEQVALRDSAAQVATRLGVRAVADLDDAERAAKLDAAVAASGWRELRAGSETGTPWASAVEVAVVAEELGRGLADASYLGPTMAADLRRLVAAPASAEAETIVMAPDLSELARMAGTVVAQTTVPLDAAGARAGLVLVPAGGDHERRDEIGRVALAAAPARPVPSACAGVDLTRPRRAVTEPGSLSVLDGQTRTLAPGDLARWHSLGLAVTCADLVGVMRGALDLACDYARARRQYGVAIGSFQAVQHMLADGLVAVEGSRSIALHAAWAVDALSPPDALAAGSAAKAYCARAALGVCEMAIQVHGGIGNTWDCLAHVFLRRALLSGEAFGGVGANLARVLSARALGGDDGLR
jgi:hypothetical protein